MVSASLHMVSFYKQQLYTLPSQYNSFHKDDIELCR